MITGIESLNLSATSWASLNDFGITRCTRTSPLRAAVGRAAADRAQHGRAPLRRRVVGEDVVDLVAAAARAQAADVRAARDSGPPARPRAGGSRPAAPRLVVVRVAVLGEAEVDERAVPGVGEAHARCDLRCQQGIPSPLGLLEEYRADPHDRRALLDGHREVLRGAHREVREPVLARPARAAPRSAAGSASGSSANGGIVISPATLHGRAGDEARAPPGRCPALPSSPATLTSTRISVSGVPWRSSWRSAESEATEWISSTSGRTCLTLRLWSWPMKCQRSARARRRPWPRAPARGSRPAA